MGKGAKRQPCHVTQLLEQHILYCACVFAKLFLCVFVCHQRVNAQLGGGDLKALR